MPLFNYSNHSYSFIPTVFKYFVQGVLQLRFLPEYLTFLTLLFTNEQ